MHTRRDFGEADPAWDALEARWMRELAAGGAPAEAAWSALYAVFGALFVKRLMRFGLDPEDAQDAAQDLWMEVTRAAPRWRGEVPVRVFLLGFLRFARKRHFHGRARLPRMESLDVDGVAAELEPLMRMLAPPSAAPEEWLDFTRCVRRAWAAFEQAHPRLAQLLLLRHVEELSLEETADLLGGDATLAKGQVYSARRKFEPDLLPCLKLWPNRERGNA